MYFTLLLNLVLEFSNLLRAMCLLVNCTRVYTAVLCIHTAVPWSIPVRWCTRPYRGTQGIVSGFVFAYCLLFRKSGTAKRFRNVGGIQNKHKISLCTIIEGKLSPVLWESLFCMRIFCMRYHIVKKIIWFEKNSLEDLTDLSETSPKLVLYCCTPKRRL